MNYWLLLGFSKVQSLLSELSPFIISLTRGSFRNSQIILFSRFGALSLRRFPQPRINQYRDLSFDRQLFFSLFFSFLYPLLHETPRPQHFWRFWTLSIFPHFFWKVVHMYWNGGVNYAFFLRWGCDLPWCRCEMIGMSIYMSLSCGICRLISRRLLRS